MSRCAVIQKTNNEVVNIIIAEPTDPVAEDCFLIGLVEDQFVDIGWFYNSETKTFYSIESKAY